MVSPVELQYALPESQVEIESTAVEVQDEVLTGRAAPGPTLPESVISLGVRGAGPRLTLTADGKTLRDTGLSLEITDDGMLKSGSLESTGELGKVVLGVVGAAATAASILSLRGPDGPDAESQEKEAFNESNPEAAELRQRYISLVAAAKERLAASAGGLEGDGAFDPGPLKDEVASYAAIVTGLEAQLTGLNEVFKAWRATTVQRRTSTTARRLGFDLLHRAATKVSEEGKVSFGVPTSAVEEIWKTLGIAIVVSPCSKVPTETPQTPRPGADEICFRVPRLVKIEIFHRDPKGIARLNESKIQLIMDSFCEVRKVRLQSSFWAKRSLELKFSDLGALNSYKYQADSAAAAIAATAGGLPASLAGGLGEGGKIGESLASRGSADRLRLLARVKSEVELKQQELTLAGLGATSADYVELEQLKQKAELLETGLKISKGGAGG